MYFWVNIQYMNIWKYWKRCRSDQTWVGKE